MNIKFSSTEPSDLFQSFANQLGAKVNEHSFKLRKHIGEGNAFQAELEDGLTFTLFDFKLKRLIKVSRTAKEDGKYFPIICWLSPQVIEQEVQGSKKHISNNSPYGIFFPSPKIESNYILPPNSHIVVLTITITKDWLRKNTNGKTQPNLLTLMESPNPFFLFEDISFNMSRYLELLKKLELNSMIGPIQLRSNVLNFLTLFVTKIERRKKVTFSPKTNHKDVEKLFHIKQIINNKYRKPPEIKELALEAAMSKRKLQKLFKEIFGITIYQYVIKVRMEKAKEMLESKRYSVSDVGYEIGYTNLSHFTTAFRKHVGVNPKQFLSNV